MANYSVHGDNAAQVPGWCRKTAGRLLGLTTVLAFGMALSGTAGAAEAGSSWFGSFFPIGERVHVETLKEEYVPFKSTGEIPHRPALLLELGDPFLDTGPLDAGFTVPVLGAVWQPRLWSYVVFRTTLQTFDNESPTRERDTEWANRLNLFVNLQLTGTEKILLGLRPVDNNQPRRFTRQQFEGAGKDGFKSELNIDVETLFFEGDFGSLVPNLDPLGIKPIDYGFTIGRQSITFQEGILINDTVDAFGLVRNNLPFPGTSNLRISAMWAWDRLDRNDRLRGAEENMYGLFIAVDAPVSTYNIDLIYVDDNTDNGDGFYAGLSAIQRIRAWGGISTAFRLNTSIALEDEIAGNVIGDGVLATVEISKTPHGSDDIVYFNTFLGAGNFTQAGREAINGGPLGNTGILFASPNLSTYGSEIRNFVSDTVGFALGYQAFWDNKRRNLIIELAGRKDYDDDGSTSEDIDSLGIGFQLQQAVGRHVQLQFEAFYTGNDSLPDGSGARFEIQIVY
jgi:hypothetical protein